MWSGSEAKIPTGWTLCDGKTLPSMVKVPDLRGRFVVGYDSTKGSGYTSIGPGTKLPKDYNITLEEKNLPSHSHSVDDYFRFDDNEGDLIDKGIATGSINLSESGRLRNDGSPSNTMFYKTHDTKTTGNKEPFDIRPPYYVLAYIIKI